MKNFVLQFIFLGCTLSVFSQAVSFIDPGQAFLKLHLDNPEQSLIRVSNYKVSGTQYLFGKQVSGDVFTPTEKGKDVLLSYNTYNQTLEIPASNGNGYLVKAAAEIDSFTLKQTDNSFIIENYTFISSGKFGDKKPVFLLQVFIGPKYNLYKAYRSELGIVSTNYTQTDLRQFDLRYDYYYQDLANKEEKLLKLKTSKSFLQKTFNTFPGVLVITDAADFNPYNENRLKRIFAIINN